MNAIMAVYIMASGPRGTIYVGATGDLARRVFEHKAGAGCGFTRKYGVSRLVWFEPCDWFDGARLREAQIKKWRRRWKLDLIEAQNPDWADLEPWR